MIDFLLGYFSDIGNIFSIENIFLISIALLWILIAVIQDFRKREVANWWSFSLIIFVLAFRAFVSVNSESAWPFLWGLIGLFFGFIIANLLYYARMFASGDAKLMLAVLTILPLSLNWMINLKILFLFLVLFILAGGVYGIIYSIVLTIIHFKLFKIEFLKQINKNKKICFLATILGIILIVAAIVYATLIWLVLGLVVIIGPGLLIFAKSLENSCMVGFVKVRDLTVGDWTVEKIKAGRKIISPNWEGLNEKELEIIQKKLDGNKKIMVKQGIPFTPAFLFGFILLIWVLSRIY